MLNVFHDPEQGDTTMTLTAPAEATSGTPFTVEGSLASAGPFATGQSVHITRTDAADPDGATLPDAAVGADGTFSFTDTATGEGEVSYEVSYDGDQAHGPARQSASLTVTKATKADTTLWLAFEDRAKAGSELKMSGRLSSQLSIPREQSSPSPARTPPAPSRHSSARARSLPTAPSRSPTSPWWPVALSTPSPSPETTHTTPAP